MEVKRALLLADVQNDFCPGGALSISRGDEIIFVLNKYIDFFFKRHLTIFVSRDWHPKRTRHFKDFGGRWPKHCIQGTKGAKFHQHLKLPRGVIILSKGVDSEKDGYSVFQSFNSQGTNFLNILNSLKISELYIGGLATDYCVKESVLGALEKGFKVKLLIDAVRGVDQKDSDKAIKKMITCGAKKITFEELSQGYGVLN